MNGHRYQEVQTTEGWAVQDTKLNTYVTKVGDNHFGMDMTQRDAHDLAAELNYEPDEVWLRGVRAAASS